MNFEIGDKVSPIDSDETFIVINVNGVKLTLADEFGFESIYSANELVIINSNQFKNIPIEKKSEHSPPSKPIKRKKKGIEVPVIDLHMERLVASHKHMSNHEIVTFQLHYLKEQLNKYIREGVKELIIVHGIGKGKLKKDVRFFLDGYSHEVEYMDDHVGYGVGATRVFIYKKRDTY